ncbi:Tyrosinase domain containing protein [Trichuris trichiura]|uniref:Tyrosinase domain containing protein n=1 Tax=Trichuris trichiura TaxID=36087 RepID=A0A077YX65_TRITR|nr:Tyrosinase domain containing protein [Trichuris trichiura]
MVVSILCLFVLLHFAIGGELDDCFNRFPIIRGRLTWEQYMLECMKNRQYNVLSGEKEPFLEESSFFTDKQLKYLHSFDDDFSSAPPFPAAVRREYRDLTKKERDAFHQCLRRMNTEKIDGVSKYDLFGKLHNIDLAPASHVGPAVLPWHREYLRRFETAMRRIDSTVSLPYWDPTIEARLENCSDSTLWSNELMGSCYGSDRSSSFTRREWYTSTEPFEFKRNLGRHGEMSFTDELLAEIADYESLAEFGVCKNVKFEKALRKTRQWVGGDMEYLKTAGKDPLFYMLLAYVDYRFEDWRQMHPHAMYPADHEACTIFHFGKTPMFPFSPLKNKDGLSRAYTTKYYSYSKSPECNTKKPTCSNPHLSCNVELKRCAGRLVPRAKCKRHLYGEEPCYNSRCLNNICVAELFLA